MNIVILSGRLARDPEIRYTMAKKAVVSFTVAVEDGKERAQFISCTAWEKTAEFIDQYFKKGDGISLIGKMTSSEYEKDGQKRKNTFVTVRSVEFPIQKPKKTDKDDAAQPGTFSEWQSDDVDLPF